MVNDKLDALNAIRKNFHGDSPEVSISLEEAEPFMPDLFNEIQEVSSKLDQIVTLVEEVKKKHSVISVSSTREKLNTELEDLTLQLSKLSKQVKLKLKKLEQDIEQQAHQNNSASFRIKKIQHAALTQRFLDTMSIYNSIQLEYRQRCKDHIKRQLDIMGHSKSDDEIDEMLESGNAAVFTQEIVSETQRAKQSLQDIKDRHADIMKLEKSIKELHVLFSEMALMVETQGELTDHIEHNVKNSANHVILGKKHLCDGLNSQRRARKKKIICIIFAIVIIIIGLIVGFSLKNL